MRSGSRSVSSLSLFGVDPAAGGLGYSEAVGHLSMLSGATLPTPVVESEPLPDLPSQVRNYPQLRFMGSKYRLLPWLHETLGQVEFDTALDAFSGSGCVAYLLKSMARR